MKQQEMDKDLEKFHQYVYGFYGKGGDWTDVIDEFKDNKVTMEMIRISTKKYIGSLNCLGREFCGDTLDREGVRDVMVWDINEMEEGVTE